MTVILGMLLKLLAYSLVLLSAVWCWYYWSHRHLIRAASKLPCSLPSLPVIGHFHYTIFGLTSLTKQLLKMSNDAMKREMYNICFWCGPMPLIIVHGVEDVKKVLTSSITAEKGDEMNYFNFAAGEGLLTAPGHIWKIMRRHMNPLLHPRNVQQMFPVFNKNSQEMTSILSKHVGGAPINCFDYAAKCALQTICNLMFGLDQEFDSNSQDFQDMCHVVERVTELFMKRTMLPWLRIDAIFEFIYKKELDSINRLWMRFTEKPIKAALANYEKKKSNLKFTDDGDNLSEGSEPLNFLDVFMVMKEKYPQFDDRSRNAQILTFLATGIDTVSLSLSSCLLTLAQYQDLQEKLYCEISTVVGPHDHVDNGHLNNMPYLNQVFKETQRWFTIIPYIIRKPSEELQLSNCKIPEGNTIIVCLYGINMNPVTYPDPERFDPERFSPDNAAIKNKFTYLPFSGGPRNCIGQTYAHMLVKTMLIHVVRRFRMTTNMDISTVRRKATVNLMNTDGYYVTLHER